MNLIRRLAVLMMTLILGAAGLPVFAYADSEDPAGDADPYTEEAVIIAEPEICEGSPGVDIPDGDELLMEYIERGVSGGTGQSGSSPGGPLRGSYVTRGSMLRGNNRVIYYRLKEGIERIAAGKETSATVYVPLSSMISLRTMYSASDLGVADLYDNKNHRFRQDALDAFWNLVSYDFDTVLDALIADLPYDLYWYDKTDGCRYGADYDCGVVIDSDGTEYFRFFDSNNHVLAEPELVFKFSVSSDYMPDSMEPYRVDTGRTSAASSCVRNASAIIDRCSGLSDHDKLIAYKDAVCELTSYDLLSGGAPYGDIWQMISVFDGDPDTNVVCEGYSKAFQFLCDHTPSFGVSGIECDSVSGTMMGGTGQGPHMWNILHMDDGKNYIADLTNCDNGSAGYPDKLFLTGCVPGGSVDDGYTYSTGTGYLNYYYRYPVSGTVVDDSTLRNFARSELEMSETDYGGPDENWSPPKFNIANPAISEIKVSSATYNGKAHKPEPVVVVNGRKLIKGTDYTITGYSNNINAGKATVTLKGMGRYEGTANVRFTIAPKKITPSVSLSASSLTYDGKVKAPAVTVRNGSSRMSSADYKVTFASGRKNVGTYKVTVTLRGNYSGSKAVTFTIVPKGTKVSKLKRARKAFTVKWTAQKAKMSKSYVGGYQIQYSTDKNFKKGNKTVKVTGYKSAKKKIKKLRRKTTYYVRIRTYMTAGGKTYYSVWSSSKSVKTK